MTLTHTKLLSAARPNCLGGHIEHAQICWCSHLENKSTNILQTEQVQNPLTSKPLIWKGFRKHHALTISNE